MKLIKIEKSLDRIFFIADLHYQHKNILDLDGRIDQFKTLEDMELYIREELSSTLCSDDLLFDLGDMFFGTRDNKFYNLLSSIPCPIYKVLGNHDKEEYFIKNSDQFEIITDLMAIEVNGEYKITLSHYPILDFPYMYHGGIEIFGHTHGHLDEFISSIPNLMLDVGFSASYSKRKGKFIHSLREILDYFKIEKLGYEDDGLDNYRECFMKWVNDKYHSEESLWR